MKRKIFWLEPVHPTLVDQIQAWVGEYTRTTPEHSALIRAVIDTIAEWSNPRGAEYLRFIEKARAQHTLRGQDRQPRNYYVWPHNFVQLRKITTQLAELGILVDESMLVRLALEEIAARFVGGDSSFAEGFSQKVASNIAPKGRARTKVLGGVKLPMASD
jgi:hypothetical protein